MAGYNQREALCVAKGLGDMTVFHSVKEAYEAVGKLILVSSDHNIRRWASLNESKSRLCL